MYFSWFFTYNGQYRRNLFSLDNIPEQYLSTFFSLLREVCDDQYDHKHQLGGGVDEVGGGTTTYVVYFPRLLQTVKCPVLGCPEVSHSAGRLQYHFMYCQFWSKVAVVQEGAETLPRCDLCGMHILVGRLIKHRQTAQCDKST